LVLLAIIVQAIIYWRQRHTMEQQWIAMKGQLKAIERQADTSDKLLTETSNLVRHNDNMVKTMQGQLDAMKEQGVFMDASLLESQKLALQTEKTAFFSKLQVDVMQIQANALTTQVEIMAKSFL